VGLGLAMSVGPVTLLIIRMNLAHGFWNGMMIGIGAVCADFTYLILLASGSLLIVNQPTVLKIVGVVGAIILFYFGYKTMRASVVINKENITPPKQHRNFIAGYLSCISSPLSILFWAGMASTVAMVAIQNNHALYYFSIGLFLGVVAWLLIINSTLRIIHHQISPKVLEVFNLIGGLTIIGFGIYGLVKAFL
jgi:threonine/homoserine/homoserine lactone efflux protein